VEDWDSILSLANQRLKNLNSQFSCFKVFIKFYF